MNCLPEKPVGTKMIKTMQHQFIRKIDLKYYSLPKVTICDLTGPLARITGRNSFDVGYCDDDLLKNPVANILTMWKNLGFKINCMLIEKTSLKHQL